MKYSEEEVALLKEEKKIAYVFSIIILVIGALFTFIYYLINPVKDWNLVIYIDIFIFALSLLVYYLMTRKIDHDLIFQEKEIYTYPVQAKESRISNIERHRRYVFEGQTSESLKKFYVFHLDVNYIRYPVELELFEQVEEGDLVELHFAKKSKLLLQIVPKNKQ